MAANRKTVGHDRIAICPIYGCETKMKLKPLKFGLFGFSKRPRCSQHQRSLVYVDELSEEFFSACASCLFDRSALPPSNLLEQVKSKDSGHIPEFIDAWIYCSSTGRNGRVISNYVDGLSRAYMALLSRKEKKAIHGGDPKERHRMLVSGIKKITSDYASFLSYLRKKTDELLPSPELVPCSPKTKYNIKRWIDAQLLGLKASKPTSVLAEKKELFDRVLSIGTALSLLGKKNDMLNKMISPHELFSGYRDFSRVGLTRELTPRDIIDLKARHDSMRKNDEEQKVISIREEEPEITDEEIDDDVVEKEHLRTYKVGLRAPESLFTRQNELAIELEVLQHVYKGLKGIKSTLFETKLSNCSKETWQEYRKAQNKYSFVNTNKKARLEVVKVKNSLKQLHWKNSRMNSVQFTKKDIPSFKAISDPEITEISLTDYQALAGKSLKMLCTHLNEQVLHQIDKIPRNKQDFLNLAFQNSQKEGKGYTESQIRNRFEIALANITGIHSNTGRTAFYQLGMAIKGYFDLREKLEHVRKLISPSVISRGDFSGEISVLLGFYSIPNNLRRYVAKSWKVDSGWVRNTLVGWRRKMDPYLPAEFQIELLTERFMLLAKLYGKHVRNDEDVKVIGKLQKKHVLHLLSNQQVDLRALLPRELHASYVYLRNKIKTGPKLLAPHVHSIDLTEFLNASDELIESVRETQSRFPPSSQPHENCKTFINKIKFIKKEASKKEFQAILNNYIIGNRFTSNVARLLANNSTYKRLFTAIRGIVALTLAKKHPSAIGQFLSAFTPENCLTFPFKSTRRDASRLPVNLLFNKYIVERKAHTTSTDYLVNQSSKLKPNVTDIFQNGEPIWLGLPIYSPHQARQFHEVVLGQRKTVRKLGTFWFQLIPSKKVVKCLRRGAEVRDIRLNVPKGPTNKVVADIVLSSRDPSSFQREGNFLKAWDDNFDNPSLPSHEFLGSDFNRIGRYMVATANPDEEHDLSKMMHRYEKAHERLEKMRCVEIPRIQARLSTGKDKLGGLILAAKRGRLMTQLTLLHQKREKLTKEMKRHALMIYLYVAWKTKAKYVGWDSIGGISTRGKRGALAQAITYLPKRKVLYDEFRRWASDLKVQGFLPHLEATVPVSPYNSQTCAECFQQTGKQEHSRVKDIPYDAFSCKRCGRNSQNDPIINRHSNSARVSAILLQNHVHAQQASIL